MVDVRKASHFVNLDEVLDQKMGYLRNLMREAKKQPTQSSESDCVPAVKEDLEHFPSNIEWDEMEVEWEWVDNTNVDG